MSSTLDKIIDPRMKIADSLSHIFARTDSVLTGVQDITFRFEKSAAPAWSTAKEIVVDASLLNDAHTVEGLIDITGLNYHEVGHVLFSPGEHNPVCKDVYANHHKVAAFQALEDMRMESLLVTRFRSTIPYLKTCYVRHIVNDKQYWDQQHLLTWGRKYLPLKVREKFRDLYKEQDKVERLSQIIDEYRLLTELNRSKQQVRAIELITEFANLIFGDISPREQDEIHGRRMMVGGAPTEEIDAVAPDDVLNADEQMEEQNARFEGGLSTEGSSDSSGDGVGSGDKSLDEMLSDVLEQAQADKDVKLDVNSKRQSVQSGNGRVMFAQVKPDANKPISPELQNAESKFSNEIARLTEQADPGWDTFQRSGKLNAGRYLIHHDIDTAFDEWSGDVNDTTDIECVLLIDGSSSMRGSEMDAANEAAWVLKRVFDKAGMSMTVLRYASGVEVVYYPHDKVDPHHMGLIMASGDTNAKEALHAAARIFNVSRKKSKLLVTLTDGKWGHPEICQGLVMAMNADGIVTALGSLPGGMNPAPFKINVQINEAFDLVQIARQAVVEFMTKQNA